MRTVTSLARSPTDRELPSDVFVRERRIGGRPEVHYRLSLNSDRAVETARRAGLPLYLLEPWVSKALGYPLSFRPRLLVGREILPAVETTAFILLPFVDPDAARSPRLEDILVAMLRIDPLGSRRILRENLDQVDPNRLQKRILAEDAERLATLVRLDEFVSILPTVGEPFPAAELAAEDAKEYGE